MKTWITRTMLAGVLPGLLALGAGAGSRVSAQAADQAQIERGKQVYSEQKCQACHSIAGVGNKRNPLDGVGSRRTEEEIRKWIVAPREMNPRVSKRAYDKLPKADLDALVAYMKALRSQ
jgi:mono/diheme cytochrome c family protein